MNVTVDDLQRDPWQCLRRVETGETIVIIRQDKVKSVLRPIAITNQLRPFGLCAGEFTVPDDFYDPLPEDMLRAFEGK